MEKLSLFCLLCMSTVAWAQNQVPEITNLSLSLTGESTLSITYDLSDAENDDCFVSLYISNDDGTTYQIEVGTAEGDLNTLITAGNNKLITWDYDGILNTSGDYKIKLVADDQQTIDIQEIVDQVDETNLFTDLSFIEGIRNRNTGLEHLLEVRDLMEDRFADYELPTEITEFAFQNFTAKNYIGKIEGTDSDGEIYILCGHYDTVSDSPGADDNGTSVAGMIEAARILSQYNFKKTIKFINFDLEESGLLGSHNYVNDNIAVHETIKGVLDFEMIGYATEEPNTQTLPAGFNILFPTAYGEVESADFRGNFIANVGKVNQNDWDLAFSGAASTYVPALRVINIVAPENWQALTPDLGRSDHAPFWIDGHPAIMISGTANFRNPNYHTPNDTIGSINFTFMSNVVKASIATLAVEAEIQHSDWTTASIDIQITGVESIFSEEMLLFPNPTQQEIYLNTDFGNITSITFTDISGKTVLDIKQPTSIIDISGLNNGVYEVVIQSGGKLFINKLVVAN